MENRAYALITGLFVIALGIAVVAAWVWLSGYGEERKTYVVVSKDTVSGLAPQSTVSFRGVPVGQVESVGFDPARFPTVLIKIRVDRDIPVTRGTYATLRIQGLTGLTQIELDATGDDPAPLSTSTDDPGKIPMRPSLINKLTDVGRDMIPNLNQLTVSLNRLLDETNRTHIRKILANTEVAAAQLVELETQTKAALEPLPALSRDARQTLKRIDTLVAGLDEISGPLKKLARNANQLSLTGQSAGEKFIHSTLPRVNTALDQLNRTTREIQQLTRHLRKNPQSLLMGRRRPPPGPGEVGYQEIR